MPLRRRIIKTGDSRSITIPASWLEEYERKLGHTIEELLIEVNSELIIKVPEDDKVRTDI